MSLRTARPRRGPERTAEPGAARPEGAAPQKLNLKGGRPLSALPILMYTSRMNLMSIDGIAKYVRDQALFTDVVFGIEHTDKIGFIGPNGAGKSTLMNILSGRLTADEGEITRNNDLRISMLEQLPRLEPETSIREQLYLSNDPRVQLLKEYHRAAEQGSPDLEELTHRVEHEGCWSLEKEYLSYLTELGIDDPDQLGGTLSGGMVKKVAMARMMASGANLLFLDEPTNHLDIDTIEWLEAWLRKTRAAFVMVTPRPVFSRFGVQYHSGAGPAEHLQVRGQLLGLPEEEAGEAGQGGPGAEPD